MKKLKPYQWGLIGGLLNIVLILLSNVQGLLFLKYWTDLWGILLTYVERLLDSVLATTPAAGFFSVIFLLFIPGFVPFYLVAKLVSFTKSKEK